MKSLLAFLFLFAFACETKTVEGPPGQSRVIEIPSQPNPEPIPPIPTPRQPEFNKYPWLTNDALVDINNPEIERTENFFYMTTFNFFNQGIRKQADETKGVNLFLNTISNEANVYNAPSANQTDSLFRVDMDEIGMTQPMWREIEANLKIKIADDTRRGEQLRFLTQKKYPIVFASDLASAVLQADESYATPGNLLYYRVTRQPLDRAAFESFVFGDSFQDRVDAEDDIHCVGGGNSAIAIGKNRQICNSEGFEGPVLDTWDVSLAANDSAFENPFLPEISRFGGQIISDSIFRFVAQETIFLRRNGFLGFRLNGAGGDKIAETIAPLDVVNNPTNAANRISAAILIGSCLQCHTSPFLPFKDQIAQHVKQNQFNGLEKDVIDAFYNQPEFDDQGRFMNEDYFRTLEKIGMRQGDPSFLHNNLINPIRGELSAAEVAGFTGLTLQEFLVQLPGASERVRNILGPLQNPNGKVQLTDLQEVFPQLIVDLNLFSD